jgi:hypothetical protein
MLGFGPPLRHRPVPRYRSDHDASPNRLWTHSCHSCTPPAGDEEFAR